MSEERPPGPPAPPPAPEPGEIDADVLYRVYGVRDQMPSLEKLLARLTSGNPYNPPGGFVFPPGKGLRRLQDALGASRDYFVMGYTREEAPDLFADAERAAAPGSGATSPEFGEHDRAIVREAKLCVVLRAQLRNPESNAYIETLLHLADAFRELLHGAVWDVRMGRLFGHEEWRERVMGEPFSVLNHVAIVAERAEGGPGAPETTLVTRGLRKFGSPDLEVRAVPPGLEAEVEGLLRDFAEHISQGDLLFAGDEIDYTHGKIRAVEAGERLRLADFDDAFPGAGARGMPKVFEALAAARRALEGRRAGGGRPADN